MGPRHLRRDYDPFYARTQVADRPGGKAALEARPAPVDPVEAEAA